jgi:homoserine kinase type II
MMPGLIASGSNTPAGVEAALVMAGCFGIGRLAALSQFESFGNENWLLEEPTGRHVVLRRYVHSNLERVTFQLRLQAHLHANGFPTARSLSSQAGAAYEPDEAGVLWAAFEHIDGREYNFSTDDAVKAARHLAQFHLLGEGLASDPPPLPHRPSLRECWANAQADIAGLRELFAGMDVSAELAYLEQWWRFAQEHWPLERLDALPSGLVHGDFHGRNLAYTDEGLAGVFDFDDVERGPFAQDLGWATYKFARESRFSPSMRPHVVHAFLDAYESVRPLSDEEHAALPVMIAMGYPPNPRYYRFYRDHHGTNLVNRLKREVGLMRFLRDEVIHLFS